MKRNGLIALLLAGLLPAAAADVLVLKNGETVRGVVRKVAGDHVVMDVYMGGDVIPTTFRIDEIRDVRREEKAALEKIEAERAEEEKEQAKSRQKAYWDNKIKSVFGKKKAPAVPAAEEGEKKKREIDDGSQDFVHDTVELMTLGTSTGQLKKTRKSLDKIEKLRKQDRKSSSTPFRVR